MALRLSAVVKPTDDAHLRLLAQVGVEHWVYYGMNGLPTELDGMEREAQRAQRCGLRLSVVEGGPRTDAIVLGDGVERDRQIEQYKRSLDHMGKIGCEVLCWNFMPPILEDAMVVRTRFDYPERGGAETSEFSVAACEEDRMTEAGVTTDEQMWDRLDYFLKAIIPAAEAAEVKLALHPDDPPRSPIWNLSRIIRTREAYERVFAAHPSPVNGLTFCLGCFLEMGKPFGEALDRLRDRIFFIHLRDVAGTPECFHETFPDNGPTDIPAFIAQCQGLKTDPFIRIDHVPRLATEGPVHGYGAMGHIFGIGYLKGLMEMTKPD